MWRRSLFRTYGCGCDVDAALEDAAEERRAASSAGDTVGKDGRVGRGHGSCGQAKSAGMGNAGASHVQEGMRAGELS